MGSTIWLDRWRQLSGWLDRRCAFTKEIMDSILWAFTGEATGRIERHQRAPRQVPAAYPTSMLGTSTHQQIALAHVHQVIRRPISKVICTWRGVKKRNIAQRIMWPAVGWGKVQYLQNSLSLGFKLLCRSGWPQSATSTLVAHGYWLWVDHLRRSWIRAGCR